MNIFKANIHANANIRTTKYTSKFFTNMKSISPKDNMQKSSSYSTGT